MGASELQSVAGNITRAVAFMIEKSPDLISKVPEDLVRDIAHYWQQMEEISDPAELVRSKSEDDLDSSNSSLPHVSWPNYGLTMSRVWSRDPVCVSVCVSVCVCVCVCVCLC